jgi:signal transduction histidine kinase
LRAKDKTFNASFSTDFDPSLEPVPVVGQDIGRVLLNLFNNAFYAVHERYKLGQADYRPTVCVSTRCAASGEVEIRVRDNGLGVPKAVQQKIFQPFFTTKPTGEGTGLGLSLSYEIITKGHNGTIQLDTREGEFTEFTVSLPVTASKLQAEAMSV